MRCASCNKFVSYSEPEVEEAQQAEVEGVEDSGKLVFTVAGSVTVRLACAECGDALKESEIEFEHETHPVDIPESFKYVAGSASWSDNGPDESSKTEGSGRGMKTFYGFVLDGTINYELESTSGEKKSESLDISIEDYVQAKFMDECQ